MPTHRNVCTICSCCLSAALEVEHESLADIEGVLQEVRGGNVVLKNCGRWTVRNGGRLDP